jgi:putative DNA primase/helicase
VGARLVFASESKEGQSLDEALIKSVTGGEEITVRFLHKEYFSYTPQFKVWMSSNNRPAIRGTDYLLPRRFLGHDQQQATQFLATREITGKDQWPCGDCGA